MDINFSTFSPEMLFSMISGKLSAAISRRLYRVFRREGIEVTPEQWTVMYYLWTRDGVTQQELCNLTFKDKPSMTRLIDNLEKLHCVERIPSKQDRRINIIKLTDKGRSLEPVTKPIVMGVIREALTTLSQEDIEVACRVLVCIFDNLRNSLETNE
ncbi:MAG: winged helix-turn-helix transcriptional regulator [Bacteroidaceae bacterium]|nr:winged helix-turn-helix transcriptional regulator [Bacteroidaceae bacterium]